MFRSVDDSPYSIIHIKNRESWKQVCWCKKKQTRNFFESLSYAKYWERSIMDVHMQFEYTEYEILLE